MKIMKKSCQRTEEDRRNLTKTVEEMIDYVREKKDAALKAVSFTHLPYCWGAV